MEVLFTGAVATHSHGWNNADVWQFVLLALVPAPDVSQKVSRWCAQHRYRKTTYRKEYETSDDGDSLTQISTASTLFKLPDNNSQEKRTMDDPGNCLRHHRCNCLRPLKRICTSVFVVHERSPLLTHRWAWTR